MITLLLTLAVQAAAPPPAASDPCQVDRAALLALAPEAFDQDLSGGWRALSERPGCTGVAADLIRDYRAAIEGRLSNLYWHEGQLRAAIGQYPAAIRLMESSRRPADQAAWNLYVDATVAFLRGDRAALRAARVRLAALPRPPGFEEYVLPNGFHVAWPPNLVVIDGLLRCFGRPYGEASSTACRGPAAPQRTSR